MTACSCLPINGPQQYSSQLTLLHRVGIMAELEQVTPSILTYLLDQAFIIITSPTPSFTARGGVQEDMRKPVGSVQRNRLDSPAALEVSTQDDLKITAASYCNQSSCRRSVHWRNLLLSLRWHIQQGGYSALLCSPLPSHRFLSSPAILTG